MTAILNDLFGKISDLSQKLFFNPVKVAPTENNPVQSEDWKKFIELRREANKHLDAKSKVVAVVITKSSSYIKGKGWVNAYYSETIMACENYTARLMQATRLGRQIETVVEFN